MPWIHTPELAYALEAMRVTEEMREQGVELDQDQAQELAHANLGPPVKWIARMPELTERARQILDQRTRTLALDQHELDHKRRQPHDHGRLREERVEVEQDHDRLQMMGLDQTAPEPRTTTAPEILETSAASAPGQGRGRSRGRGRQQGAVRKKKCAKMTPMEKFLAESMDAVHFEDEE
jgi:hypothetical protein